MWMWKSMALKLGAAGVAFGVGYLTWRLLRRY